MTEFKHSNSVLFFWNDQQELPDTLKTGYSLAFFGAQNFSALADSWNNSNGVYLFLKIKEGDLDQSIFTTRLRDFLFQESNRDVRFLWIENPGHPFHSWQTFQLSVNGSRTAISQISYFDFRNYTFSVSRNCTISLNNANDGFLITRSEEEQGFELSTDYGRHRMYNFFETKEENGSVTNEFIEIFKKEATLPMSGDQAGCLQIDLSVRKVVNNSTYGYPDLAHLDVGMRIFMRDPEFPDTDAVFDINAHRYPLIDETGDHIFGSQYYPASIDFGLNLDPLNSLDPDRTFFKILPGDNRLQQLGIPSGYRTNLGYIVHLIPEPDQCKLVFAERLASSDAPEKAPFYLVPSGEFEIKVPRYQKDGSIGTVDFVDNVVCGISGLEYVKLTPGFKDSIVFKPGYPAFAPSYVSVAAALRQVSALLDQMSKSEILDILKQDLFLDTFELDSDLEASFADLTTDDDVRKWLEEVFSKMSYDSGEDSLTNLATTSYVYIRQSGDGHAVYYAQPNQAILHKAGSTPEFFDYMEVPALGLPDQLPDDSVLAFPMLPYGQADPAILSDFKILEEKIIVKVRSERMRGIGLADDFHTSLLPNNTQPSALTGTTPQGLLATFSSDFKTWERLVMARGTNVKDKDGNVTATLGKEIALTHIPHESTFKNALQTNPLFMVITKPEELKAYFTEHQLEIDGWTFDLNPDSWSKQGTILIFKFQEKPLIELAADPEYWIQGKNLNQDVRKTSKKIVDILQNAIDALDIDDTRARKKYETLARIAQFEAWTGIVALNINVPLGGLPTELKALAGGIDANKFYAQYLGIEITPIKPDGNSLVSKQSSLFGLIDYKNDNVPAAGTSGYNFHVSFLTVVFNNSAISDFAAEILVIIDLLFGERPQLLGRLDGRNIISLKGTAEQHNGKTTYAFGFSGDNRFLLPDSEVIDEIEIIKVTFATDPIPNPDADPLPIRGRFFFWSRLRFAWKEEFDILSFGAEPTPPKEGESDPGFLSSSNLQVVMSFQLLQAANKVEQKVFTIVEDKLNFDLIRSGFRKQSLYEKFPLKLLSLQVVKNNANALEQSGYMPVKSPLSGGTLGNSWYGLVFDLNMGSLGALAGKAGLVASMLIAWSPSSDKNAGGIYVGLKLPGSTGGKKEIVIQGILKIVFKGIEFVVYPTTDPEGVGYLLKLKNIVLKFFILSLPPSGQSEIILFGDPREGIDRKDKLVGWYAAYAK